MTTRKHGIHEADNKMLLQALLKSTCQEHEVPEDTQSQIVTDGVKYFTIISDGSVLPKAGYRTVEEYVQQHRHDKQQESSSGKTTKETLLEEMDRHSRAGNISAYKICRQKYSACD